MFNTLYRKSVAVINSLYILIWSIFFLKPILWFKFWFSFAPDKTITLDSLSVVIRSKNLTSKLVDLYMAASCILSKQYSPEAFHIQKTDTIIDVGAHIGSFSIFAARRAREGRVYSFEPDPDNYEQLKKNVIANNLKNITTTRKAVFNSSGTSYLYKDKNNSAEHGLYRKNTQRIEISTISIEDIFKQNNIDKCDLLKLDCEGTEYDIIFNAQGGVMDKIEKIVMECHTPDFFGITNPLYSQENMLQHLNSLGFKTRVKPENAMHGLIFAKRSDDKISKKN